MIIVGSCAQCSGESHLTVVDTNFINPELARGAAWTCPHCHTANRLPVLALVTSVIAVDRSAD